MCEREYRRCCINVDSIGEIVNYDYDYVLVAVVDSVASYDMKMKLIDYGVSLEKILRVEISNEDRETKLNIFLNGVSNYE